MNSIIISALVASVLVGVSTADPSCALAPLIPKIYGAVDVACAAFGVTGCLSSMGQDEETCPTIPCTVAATVNAAVGGGALIGLTLPQMVAMVDAQEGLSLTMMDVAAAQAQPEGEVAKATRTTLLDFAAVLDAKCGA